MKLLLSILIFFSATHMMGQSNDTNYLNKDNFKQGYWQILGKDRKLPNYKPNQIIEEGNYVNSRKQGLWIKYHSNGKVKSKITFKNSRPNGLYETYYENGLLEEKGTWIGSRSGYFERWDYDENGCLSVWVKYRKDTITEVKKYVTCNCLLYEIVIDTTTGLGVKKEYENGKLKKTSNYTLEMETAIKDSMATYNFHYTEFKFTPKKSKYFKGSKKLYNEKKQVVMEGYFKKNKLIDGKWYIYDEKGVLVEIQIYYKGRYFATEVIRSNEK